MAQTGVQILFAFLLALSFQARFAAPAIALAAGVLAWFTMWWFVLPLRTRVRQLTADDHSPDDEGPSALS